jgi:hypothetical protein
MRFYRTWDGGTANLPQGLPPAYPSPAFPDLGLLGAIRSYSELFGVVRTSKITQCPPPAPRIGANRSSRGQKRVGGQPGLQSAQFPVLQSRPEIGQPKCHVSPGQVQAESRLSPGKVQVKNPRNPAESRRIQVDLFFPSFFSRLSNFERVSAWSPPAEPAHRSGKCRRVAPPALP